MPLLDVSDGIYHKLENSTRPIYPLTSIMHMLQNGAMVSMYSIVSNG